jgi:hypothetical protein
MPGTVDRNLRMGTLSEDLGVLLLSSFCAVAPVPRPQDVGIDVVCTLLRPDGPRRLLAEDSFYVQIKSSSIEKVEFVGDEYEWFKRLDLPFFVARVDKKSCILELFTVVNVRIHFIEDSYQGISLSFVETPQTIEKDGIRLSCFGSPIARIQIQDMTDAGKLERFYEIVKAFVRVEVDNRRQIRARTMQHLRWVTNEVPTATTQMTLVNNAAPGQYQDEVLQILLETLKGTLSAFTESPESLQAIMPLLDYADRRGLLTKEDKANMHFLIYVMEHQDGQKLAKDERFAQKRPVVPT